MKSTTSTRILATVVLTLLGGAVPVSADPGDPAGWSLAIDPRHRAFLNWTAQADGPRVLMLGCLRDAETFTTMSAAVGEREETKKARLRLINGPSAFEVEGEVTFYPQTNHSAFISDVDADATAMRVIGQRLQPVLAGGDITVEIRPVGATTPTSRAVIRREGLDRFLPRFAQVCFH